MSVRKWDRGWWNLRIQGSKKLGLCEARLESRFASTEFPQPFVCPFEIRSRDHVHHYGRACQGRGWVWPIL